MHSLFIIAREKGRREGEREKKGRRERERDTQSRMYI
jgi:hypothetical protein